MPASSVPLLTEISVQDMLVALGVSRSRLGRALFGPLCRPFARRFAEEVADYDDRVGERGLREGARWYLDRSPARLEVAGLEHLPPSGPLLVVANHPGVADTLALFASLPRTDLRIVSAARPFLLALAYTRNHLIAFDDEHGDRLTVVREVAAHLRAGGAVLTFPRGEIEPDPAVLDGAAASVDRWSASTGLFARLEPRTAIVPAIVSGVLSPAAQRSPLVRLRHARADRERLGAMLQVALPAYQDVAIRVAFGPALQAAGLMEFDAGPRAIADAVHAAARTLLARPPRTWQTVVAGNRPAVAGLPAPTDTLPAGAT